jgi:hypothetical protein
MSPVALPVLPFRSKVVIVVQVAPLLPLHDNVVFTSCDNIEGVPVRVVLSHNKPWVVVVGLFDGAFQS